MSTASALTSCRANVSAPPAFGTTTAAPDAIASSDATPSAWYVERSAKTCTCDIKRRKLPVIEDAEEAVREVEPERAQRGIRAVGPEEDDLDARRRASRARLRITSTVRPGCRRGVEGRTIAAIRTGLAAGSGSRGRKTSASKLAETSAQSRPVRAVTSSAFHFDFEKRFMPGTRPYEANARRKSSEPSA